MEAALIGLVAYAGRFLDPQGKYFFVDKLIPNIVGHRDVLSTSCPGDNFYWSPRRRAERRGRVSSAPPRRWTWRSPASRVARRSPSKTPYTVIVTVKNTGTAVIPSTFDKGLTYTEEENYETKKAPQVLGRFRIVADIEGSPTASKPGNEPYRWGFGKSLNPGDTVDVPCKISFTTAGSRKLKFGLVQEKTGVLGAGARWPDRARDRQSGRAGSEADDAEQRPALLRGDQSHAAAARHCATGRSSVGSRSSATRSPKSSRS